jgi:2-hydroxychromene-2-carboxylate isomerase
VKTIDWYFDFISPFSYLASESLARLPDEVEIRAHPILFAGLLNHYQTKGPAEIEPMRRFTFRHIRWLADRGGIPLTLPPLHPFNPLKLLRLSIALGNDLALVQRLYRFVWAEGRSTDDPAQWRELLSELRIDDADALIATPEVKDRLRQNTEAAIAAGVFGVPSFVVDGEIFWGFDSIDFVREFLANPGLFESPDMHAADTMPEGAGRHEADNQGSTKR